MLQDDCYVESTPVCRTEVYQASLPKTPNCMKNFTYTNTNNSPEAYDPEITNARSLTHVRTH